MSGEARVRIKICCIADLEEARLAVEAGADVLGLVSAMPSGPGPIPEESIAAIAAAAPPGVATFLLTCAQDAETLIAQQRRTGVTALQLVDRIDRETYRALRNALPAVRLVQVVHVAGPESVDEARSVAPHVDALLLDSGNPSLPVKELGGTGRVHEWAFSGAIRDAVRAPVYLAGGLRPENVADALQTVAPFGLDVCTGVRAGGRLDEGRLTRFISTARNTAASGSGQGKPLGRQ